MCVSIGVFDGNEKKKQCSKKNYLHIRQLFGSNQKYSVSLEISFKIKNIRSNYPIYVTLVGEC